MFLPTGRALLDPERILTEAGLALQEHYADFGAGTLGHFVIPAAAMVGKTGIVYAVDVLPDALSSVRSRAAFEGMSNLVTVWGDLEHPQGTAEIPEHSVDLVSLVNVCGLLKKSPRVLTNTIRVLKENGRLLLVDWKKSSAAFGPPVERRHNPEEFPPLLTSQGFTLQKTFDAGPHHWGLLFIRRAL
jgi:ubiquinone/menaquinone biosynthesis C-methylase UbiE